MEIFYSINDYQSWRSKQEASLGFVPTMGALHEGHLSLVKEAKKLCSKTVVSIFVNPTQFAPGEDFERYPRTREKDLELLRKLNVNAVFIPEADEIYPKKNHIWVNSDAKAASVLCGAKREGHFRGVLTVVNLLFNIVRPSHSFFGEKDYQQLFLIKQMVLQSHQSVQIEPVAIFRENDGLAMSSRNRYLSEEERKKAPLLHQGLKQAAKDILKGDKVAEILDRLKRSLEEEMNAKIDYIDLRRINDLALSHDTKEPSRLFAALYLGNTRLIDNIAVK